MFNVSRLDLARKRRKLTSKALAELANVSPVTVSRILNRKQEADESTQAALIDVLGFPFPYFYKDDVDCILPETASFRSLSSMTARERDAALASGEVAFEVTDWVEERYNLPEQDIPDLGNGERSPESAARMLRQIWSIGERPIGSVVELLEAKGVRVFSLSESTKNVDAFSIWRNDSPFVFLNTFKSAERSRFDAMHELGHLVLHKHGGPSGRPAENEANRFASSFLMPSEDVRARLPIVGTLEDVIAAKNRWGVSAAALCYRLHKLRIVSDWQYRSFCIQLRQRFGNGEPKPMNREVSKVWVKVFEDLWKQRKSRTAIAADICIPDSELDSLVFGLTGPIEPPQPTNVSSLKPAIPRD